MAIGTDVICKLAAENNSEVLAVILSVVFGIYILFDSILGAITVGSKAFSPLQPPKSLGDAPKARTLGGMVLDANAGAS